MLLQLMSLTSLMIQLGEGRGLVYSLGNAPGSKGPSKGFVELG